MANLFIAVMYCDEELLAKVKEKLIEMHGEIKKQSKAYDFDRFTNYYEKEMGKNIKKIFFVLIRKLTKIIFLR